MEGAELTERWTRRLARHHLPLAAATVLAVGLVGAAAPGVPIARLSIATAHVSLGLLAWTLVIGPLAVLRGRRAPVSLDLRRDIALWGAGLAFVHVVAGLQVHMNSPLAYFVERRAGVPMVRLDAFGLTNYAGLLATLILLGLAVLSRDRALTRLGSARWKRWQRTTYLMLPLVLAHAVVYQVIERRHAPWLLWSTACAAVVLILQLAGARAVRARRVPR